MPVNRFSPTDTRFKFNETYDPAGDGEANTYQEIYLEATWKHGWDVVYIERSVGEAYEPVFVEALAETLKRGTAMRFFIEEAENWTGMGDMLGKFGLRVGDEMTCYCPKELFARTRPGDKTFFPKQHDLIYVKRANKLYEIAGVEDEIAPSFYLFGNRVTYKFTCKTFIYEHQEIAQTPSSGIPVEIQKLDREEENTNDIAANTTPWTDYEETTGVIDDTETDLLLK